MTWLKSRHRPAMLLGVIACLLAACIVPDADQSIADAASQNATGNVTTSAKAPIEGATGPLTQSESHALLASIRTAIGGTGSSGTGGSDILQRHLAIEQAVAGSPLTADNDIAILRDGPETFKAIADAIRGARHNLNLEYYTIEDVTFDGGSATLSDLLLERRRAGVAVNIIYDSYGSSDTPAAFFEKLAEAGVELLAYHPIAPTNPANALTLNDRDHRKILVADGSIGVVGGVNLAKNYQSKSPGSDKEQARPQEKTPQPSTDPAGDPATLGDAIGLTNPLPSEWRDTAMRIKGPAVAELQALFRDQWNAEHETPLAEAGLFPDLHAEGNQVARIIGSSPDDEIPRYYVTLISALRNAEVRAWVSAAYFVPTPEQKETLMEAAGRGVDVRLLLADNSDSPPAIGAARSHYSDLLQAGVKIYETQGVVLHAKSVVIDGVWSAIGSSNFDHRSVLYNDEVEAIVLGAETAQELERVFEDGMAIADRIDPAAWEAERTLPDRVKGTISRIIENLL